MKGTYEKEEFLDSLDWNCKSRRFCRADSDVTLTIGKDKYIKLTFRNEVWDCITSTGYVVFAICKNRIIFKEADSRNGYKLCKSGNTPSRYLFTTVECPTEFIGDYELLYDDFLELYYIAR